MTFVPTKVFDRVQVTLGGLANVLSTLNLYEAQRLIPSPVIKINNVIGNNAQVCTASAATFTASAVPNTIFNWYTTATGGTPVFTGATFTTPALIATTNYYVSAMRNGCTDESQRTPITATVNAIPAAPVVTNANLNVCPSQTATFTAQSVTGVTVNWYSAATGGTLLATGNNFTTAPLTQTTSYYAEGVSGGSCTSPTRTLVTATVTSPPAAPALVTAADTICDGNVAALAISTPQAGITYNWYSAATGGTSIYTGTNFNTPVLNTNTTYYAEAANSSGCTSTTRTPATVTVIPTPANPVVVANNASIAAGQSTTIAVTNSQTGITYNWYTSAAAGTPVFTGVTYQTPLLYANTTYYVSATNATGCTSASRTAITINVNINNNAPCTFANQQSNSVNAICIGCGVTNPALATDADTTTASTINVLAGLIGGNAQQQLIFQQPGFAGDTVKLVLQNPAGLLSASVLGQISVTFYNGATQGTTYLLNNALIKVNLLAGASGKYAVLIPATGTYDRITVQVNGVASVLTSLNIYYALQQFPAPVFSPVSPEICSGGTATINITSPAPATGTFNWFTTPTGGTSIHTGASFTTPTLSATTTYYVDYSRGTCDGAVRYPVQILIDNVPAAPVITTQNVTVTSGQPATLGATATNGATVQWFTAATGGVPVGTGNTFTTPPLTTNTTYYAGTAAGSCVLTTRTPVLVTVQPVVIPDVTVTPPTVTINMGQSTTFTASSTTAGAVFNWFTAPTGGTSIYTGATYTTPSLFANTTYYAEASIPSTGAISASRGSGVVTVNQSGLNPVSCDAAIDQTTATSGVLCVGCSIANATGSVDNDRNTFSQLNVPVGLVNAYASQTLRFANTGIAGDSIIVELGIPGSLASVSVLSQISLDTYNGATDNNDRFTVNGSLINISLLNGTSVFKVAFKALHNFDRVEVRLNAALAGVFNSLNIYDAVQEVPAPVISTPALTVCQGTQATITATAPADVTVNWYTAATGGSPIFTGSTFTTPALTTTTTYYASASRTADGCVQAIRTPATVTVLPIPAAPVVANSNITICSGQPATFSVQAVNGVTYNWFTSKTGGTSLFTGTSFTTPSLSATTSYFVEADNSGQCASSSRTQVTATVTATPQNAVVTPATVQVCFGSSTVLTASSSQPGVTFNWYAAATGGTPIFTGAQFTTPALTTNTTYYVEAASGSCVSPSRTAADVTVNPLPVSPTVVVSPVGAQVTSGQTAQITASSTTPGVLFNWYTTSTGGSPIFTGATFTTPALTTTTTYYVEAASSATGCTSSTRTPVTITVNTIFSTSCDFASTQTNSNSGVACVGCSVTTPNNAVDSDTTNFSQLNLPTGIGGFVSQKLIFGDAGDPGDTVTVKISIPVSLATVGVLNQLQIGSYNGNTNNGDAVLLSNSSVKVQVLPGGQTAIIKFVPKATFTAVELQLLGTLSLINSLDIYYASKQVAIPQLATQTNNICAGSSATFTIGKPAANVTYNWYASATGGASLHTGITFTTPALNATTTYYAESARTANGCANPNRVAATANVTPSPLVPILAQSPIQICSGDPATLLVTNANGATVNWYDAPVGGTLVFTGASFTVSPIATINYYAEITNGTCTSPSRAVATVTVNPRPASPGVQSANVLVCSGSPATLQVLNPASGVTYDWFTAATGGTVVFSGATFVTPAITQNTIYYVQATSAATGCANNGSRTQVNITTSPQVNAPVLSAVTTNVCSGGSASISVNNPVSGLQYAWYTQPSGGTPVFTGTTFTLDNLTANASYFVEASNSTGCVSASRTETDITVQPVPTPPQISANAGSLTVCQGSSASLSIVNPLPNEVYRWYDAATGGTLFYTGSQFNTPVLSVTTTYYVEASQAGNCTSSVRTAVTVTIDQLPPDPALVSSILAVCTGSPATFTISSPQSGITYEWFDSPGQTNKLFTGTTFVTGPINTNTIFYVAAINATGCQSAGLGTAQATVVAPPSAPVIGGGNNVQTCAGSTAVFTISNPQAGFIYNWYATATGGTPIYTGPTFTTPVINGNTTYYAEAVNSTGCNSPTRTAANVTLLPSPPAPQVSASGTSVCEGSTAILTATTGDPTNIINWYSSATGGTPLFTGNNFTIPPLNITTTYYAEASISGGCSSATRTAATVTVLQPFAAPVITVTATTPSSITFGWSTVPGATGYDVSFDDGATFITTTGTSYTISNLKPAESKTVRVRVRGNFSCELSAYSAAVTGITPNPLGDQVFIPNAFSPNGDGNNDIFYVYGNVIKTVNLSIYDQWGGLLFTSNQLSRGWDGTYKGKPQPVGVYVYRVEAVLSDGETLKRKGTINLLR